MKKHRAYYLHLLNGQPAIFDGKSLYYATRRGRVLPLVRDLKQLCREQKASAHWRESGGFVKVGEDRYGYIRVEIPNED